MAISNINGFNNKNNSVRNTLIGAGIAATGAAYAGYVTTSPLNKRGQIKDEFIHNIIKTQLPEKVDKKFADFARDVDKMGAHPTGKDIKFFEKYVLENAKDLGFLEVTDLNPANRISIYEYIENIQTGYRENVSIVKDNLKEIFDIKKNSFKKLSENTNDEVIEFANTAKKALTNMKTQKALKFAGVGVLAGGIASFIATKIAEKK